MAAKTFAQRCPRYQGEIAMAYGLGVGDADGMNRAVFETVHGVRINPYVFVGLGLGYNYFYDTFSLYEYDWDSWYEDDNDFGVLTAFANAKAYIPISDRFSVNFSLDLGSAYGVLNAEGKEFYTSVGPGINWGSRKGSPRGDFGIRFQYLGEGLNAVLFRIAFDF